MHRSKAARASPHDAGAIQVRYGVTPRAAGFALLTATLRRNGRAPQGGVSEAELHRSDGLSRQRTSRHRRKTSALTREGTNGGGRVAHRHPTWTAPTS